VTDKTLKIAQELHDLLKLKALQERRTLQDVTEELISEGLKRTDQGADQGLAERGHSRGDRSKA